MPLRTFLKSFTALVGCLALPALALPSPSGRGIEGEGAHGRPPGTESKVLQHSPLAEFQYHHGRMLYPLLAVRPDETTSHSTRPSKNDDQIAGYEPAEGSLQLVREPDNRFDVRAVRVEWQGRKLGYIPRLDNAAVSQLLDHGETLEAAIARLENSSNPWDRVMVEVRWIM